MVLLGTQITWNTGRVETLVPVDARTFMLPGQPDAEPMQAQLCPDGSTLRWSNGYTWTREALTIRCFFCLVMC